LGRSLSWRTLARAALPIVAILLFGSAVGAVLAVAGDTLGYDFLAYHRAAGRVLAGQPVYDLSFEVSGGFGLFYYPPMFAPLILPFGLLSEAAATWAWISLLIAAFAFGVAILPVSRTVRWWILLAAGVSWLLPYAIKLGQVGPLLFLLFAIGWRWLDSPVRLGVASALGTAVKLQPGVVLVWALLTRRWMAVLVAVVVLVVLSAAATVLAGVDAWSDFVRLVGQVGDPIRTPRNATPGAIAFQLGVPAELATVIQWASTLAVLAIVVLASRRATAEAGYLVAVTASQAISPILWDHYAVLLLLPVAYLCAAGRWWALLIPLATAAPLLGLGPPIIFPIAFAVVLMATFVTGVAGQGNRSRVAGASGAA
jgi:alpha-1,2-mannosyltransferase